MKRPFILIVAALTLLATAVPALAQDATPTPVPPICLNYVGQPDDIRTSYYMGEGLGYYASGEFSRAINSFTCVIFEIDANYAPAYMARALVLTQRSDYERALEDYTRAIQLNGTDLSGYNNRGIVYTLQREYDEALADFNQALELDSRSVVARNNRAVVYALQGEYELAIADLQQAIETTGIDAVLADLLDPEREEGTPPIRDYDLIEAQPYALLGIIYSAFALDNYQAYLRLTGSNGDFRIQSAAGALESRFTFDLRLDDGTWLLVADFAPEG